MSKNETISVYYTQFDEPWPKADFDRLMEIIPSGLRDRVMKLNDWDLRQGSLARKLLLMHGLKAAGYDDPTPFKHVEFMESGKPIIPGAPNFSLSNDGNWAVCCLNDTGELGIDLERIKPINLSDYQSEMTYPEWREIYSHVIPLRRFYEFWTIKESVIKADGIPKKIEVKDIFIRPDVAFCHGRYWYIHPMELDYNYVCFLVSSEPQQEIVMHEVDVRKLF